MGLQESFTQRENKEKKDLLERNFGYFGKVVEQDNKIIVYVSQDYVDGESIIYLYELTYFGLYEHDKMCEYFSDYSICFVLDGLTFSKKVFLSLNFGKKMDAYITNCLFEEDVTIENGGDNIILDNNRYLCSLSLYSLHNLYAPNCGMCMWTIKNEGNTDSYDRGSMHNLNIYSNVVKIISSTLRVNSAVINTGQMIMENSNIIAENEISINSKSMLLNKSLIQSDYGISILNEYNNIYNIYSFKQMVMRNSKIMSDGEISILFEHITLDDSGIQSKYGVVIEGAINHISGIIDAPIIFLNDEDLSVIDKDKDKEKEKEARKNFVMVLSKIRDHINQQNQEKLLTIQKKLELQEVGQVLIKKPE